MTSRRSATLDAVAPAWRVVPPSASSAGDEAIELAASAGLHLDPWQQDAVRDLLGEDDGGFWAATTGGLVCPRQNGKGSIIEALELAWLFLFDVELIFHSAHLFATSADAYRRIKFLIQNTPDLHRQVLRYTEAHGQEGIELRSGQRLRFVTRSKSGGRGFPAPVVVLDEAFNLSQQAMAALVPTMAAQSNPFLLLTSSAPIDDPCSDVLRQFMRRSRTGEVERRCYIEFAADPKAGPDEQLRQANPGYGIRLNDDVIAEERELLTPEAFRIERLGIVDLDNTGDLVLPADKWALTGSDVASDGPPSVFAVDVSPMQASAAIAAGGTIEGLPAAQILEHHSGTAWLVPRMLDLRTQHPHVRFVAAFNGPAGSIVEDARRAGIDIESVSTAEQAAACSALLAKVTEERMRHRHDPVLDRALAGATKRDMGDGAWLWSRRSSLVDISPLVAFTIALDQAGTSSSIYEDRGLVEL